MKPSRALALVGADRARAFGATLLAVPEAAAAAAASQVAIAHQCSRSIDARGQCLARVKVAALRRSSFGECAEITAAARADRRVSRRC